MSTALWGRSGEHYQDRLDRTMFCLPDQRFPMGRTEGKNGSFIAIRKKIHQNFMTASCTWKKKLGPEAMPKFWIVMWYICSVTVLRGTHWVPWCILKTNIYRLHISVVLFSCFKKFKCLCDVLVSVSLQEFAKLRSQLLDVFIISSDFDLAQNFSCSVKTVYLGYWNFTDLKKTIFDLIIPRYIQIWQAKEMSHDFVENPNSSKKFAKLFLIFQKLDHLPCNKILELV